LRLNMVWPFRKDALPSTPPVEDNSLRFDSELSSLTEIPVTAPLFTVTVKNLPLLQRKGHTCMRPQKVISTMVEEQAHKKA